MRDDIVLLVGRLLLAWIFLHEGAFLLANYSASSAAWRKWARRRIRAGACHRLAARRRPLNRAWLLCKVRRVALGLFCLATACCSTPISSIRNELLHFEKDIAIAGGLFVLVVCGAGRWSVDGWRRAGTGT